MIRLRLSRTHTIDSRIIRLPASSDTVRPPATSLMVMGVLLQAAPPDAAYAAPVVASSWEEGIQYDAAVVLLLDRPADDGRPRVFLTSAVRLIMTSGSPHYVPIRLVTAGSEYLVDLLP